MAATVTTSGVRQQLRSLERRVGTGRLRGAGTAASRRDPILRARTWLGFTVCETLRDAPRSSGSYRSGSVPYDSGQMQDSYVFMLAGDQRNIRLGNAARAPDGFSYPQMHERKGRVAERVIRANRAGIAREATRKLRSGQGRRPYTGIRRVRSLSRR